MSTNWYIGESGSEQLVWSCGGALGSASVGEVSSILDELDPGIAAAISPVAGDYYLDNIDARRFSLVQSALAELVRRLKLKQEAEPDEGRRRFTRLLTDEIRDLLDRVRRDPRYQPDFESPFDA